MPDIIQSLRDAYIENPAAALNMLPELFRQYDEGLIKALPCKVGDKIFLQNFCKKEYGEIPFFEDSVLSVHVYSKFMAIQASKSGIIFPADAIGKTVFLTRAEAEKALDGSKPTDDKDTLVR